MVKQHGPAAGPATSKCSKEMQQGHEAHTLVFYGSPIITNKKGPVWLHGFAVCTEEQELS
jgi:hypothetical protein